MEKQPKGCRIFLKDGHVISAERSAVQVYHDLYEYRIAELSFTRLSGDNDDARVLCVRMENIEYILDN